MENVNIRGSGDHPSPSVGTPPAPVGRRREEHENRGKYNRRG